MRLTGPDRSAMEEKAPTQSAWESQLSNSLLFHSSLLLWRREAELQSLNVQSLYNCAGSSGAHVEHACCPVVVGSLFIFTPRPWYSTWHIHHQSYGRIHCKHLNSDVETSLFSTSRWYFVTVSARKCCFQILFRPRSFSGLPPYDHSISMFQYNLCCFLYQ